MRAWPRRARRARTTQTRISSNGMNRSAALILLAVLLIQVATRAQNAPSSRTVWDGVYTSSQADRGRGFYNEHCAQCHGGNLQGGESRALTGDRFWTTWQETTVDRLLGHVSTNM